MNNDVFGMTRRKTSFQEQNELFAIKIEWRGKGEVRIETIIIGIRKGNFIDRVYWFTGEQCYVSTTCTTLRKYYIGNLVLSSAPFLFFKNVTIFTSIFRQA